MLIVGRGDGRTNRWLLIVMAHPVSRSAASEPGTTDGVQHGKKQWPVWSVVER
jgi:hypothetical protein